MKKLFVMATVLIGIANFAPHMVHAEEQPPVWGVTPPPPGTTTPGTTPTTP